MRTLIREMPAGPGPLALAQGLGRQPGVALLHSALPSSDESRFSFLACRPFARLEARGHLCRLSAGSRTAVLYANPWRLASSLMLRYELLEERDLPFPLGAAIGFWGYEMGRIASDSPWPDLSLGFYDSLCAFDHRLDRCWAVSTGMRFDGSRCAGLARRRMESWRRRMEEDPAEGGPREEFWTGPARSSLQEEGFLRRVERALGYIGAGDIYQVNLSRRIELPFGGDPMDLYSRLAEVSPAPFSAWLDCGETALASASPESFLRMAGRHVRTRPIKGTRPRHADPRRDALLARELERSPKERAELVMITDLMRSDLGRICEYGSVEAPSSFALESFPQVHHQVATVEGMLREGTSHLEALEACFPPGSVTGAPKARAMEIIGELEPVERGPYTGAVGYLGFNQISHLSVAIRTAFLREGRASFSTGAGIVADSDPRSEWRETEDKASGFLRAARSEEAPLPQA